MVSVPRMTSVCGMNSKVWVSEGEDCLKEFVKISMVEIGSEDRGELLSSC